MYKLADVPLRRRTWIQIAQLPKARIGWEFEDCSEVTTNDLSKVMLWVKQLQTGNIIRAEGKKSCGKGLLISGDPGHGKTTLAAVVIQEILRTFSPETFVIEPGRTLIRPCYFITFASLIDLKGDTMNKERDDEDEKLYQGIMGTCGDDAYNVRVLIIDDIGKEHATASGWNKSMLHHVIRTRFDLGLPTIVTTNVPLNAWDAKYGNATESFAREAFSHLVLESKKGDLRK
jgi:hypothetical protein